MMVDKYLDPDRKYFTHFLYRTNCRAFTGVYWFHYKFIGDIGRDLSRVMAIDNSVYAFGTSLDNLVPIKDYYNDQDDNELLKRLAIIDGFFSSPFNDVREYLIPIFGLTELQKEAKADSLADLEMFKGW
jgi:TFIIF-interacting CTD phosphatase-like protein